MLVIHPDECIDCGVCEPECPADAIVADTQPEAAKWLALNTEYANIWPNIAEKTVAPSDADSFKDAPDKFKRFFDPEPVTQTA